MEYFMQYWYILIYIYIYIYIDTYHWYKQGKEEDQELSLEELLSRLSEL